jgi:L-asparagine oxygenase
MTAGRRTSELTLSLSAVEVERLRQAAQRCVDRDLVEHSEAFVGQAQRSISVLPDELLDCLRAFRRYGSPTGGLLIRGLPLFEVPATPADPGLGIGTTVTAAGLLGIISAVIGDQYGFKPELDGQLVQDIVPVRGFEQAQQSLSSDAELYTHVELAFADDNDRADTLALLCLRADHERTAATTLSSIEEILPHLSDDTVEVLGQPRFRTTVDMSFLRGLGRDAPIFVGPIRILIGDNARPRVRADFAETSGIDADAQVALDELRRAADRLALVVRLAPGDLLLVDNQHAFHGRTPFRARWDGADRWLLRTSITRDLSRSEAHRPGDGRVIDVDYGGRDDVPTMHHEEVAV